MVSPSAGHELLQWAFCADIELRKAFSIPSSDASMLLEWISSEAQ
jgi:hypothetical protein